MMRVVSFDFARRGVIPVMSVILVVFVVVVFVVVFKSWSEEFSSDVMSQKDSQISQIKNEYSSDLIRVVDGFLFFDSDFYNLSVERLVVGGRECDVDVVYVRKGLNKFNLTSCFVDLGDGVFSLQMFTDKVIFKKSFKIRNLTSYE